MPKFKYKDGYIPDEFEKLRMEHVQKRLRAMSTDYRRALIKMAQDGRDAADGMATEDDRISNAELLKVPVSHAVIMQRLSTLADNPSHAIYRSPNNDKRRLEITNQLNNHDKKESNYFASYLTMQSIAEKEGVVFVRQGWHEETKEIDGKTVTVGEIFSDQDHVKIENMFWDPVANQLRGEVGIVANDVIERQFYNELDFRIMAEENGWYNVEYVKPCTGQSDFMYEWNYQENIYDYEFDRDKRLDSEQIINNDQSKEVVMWIYTARKFYDDENETVTDVQIFYANGVEVYKSEIPVPDNKGAAELPYYKLVAIPTGLMGGLSIPALIRHPEKALQRMITMADATAELGVNPIQFMSSAIMDTIEDAPLFPGARIEVENAARSVADEIYIHQSPDITNGAIFIIDKMIEFIIMITGVDIRALFESPRTKAISTERKREIQEKLLRFSVIYNEAFGYTHMEKLRLRIMLENYPIKRNFLDINADGEEEIVARYPKIPIKGYQVKIIEGDEEETSDKQRVELARSPQTDSFISINPFNIEPQTILYVEGATQAANEDTFKLTKALDKIKVISTNPWTSQTTDPVKGARWVYRTLGIAEEDIMREELEGASDNEHGAVKEIRALLMFDFKKIEIPLSDEYEPDEYEEIFTNFIASDDVFDPLSETVKSAIIERLAFHRENALNPYFKEQLKADRAAAARAKELAAAQQAEAGNNASVNAAEQAQFNTIEVEGLTDVVESKAGKLGKAGKTPAANSAEQTK